MAHPGDVLAPPAGTHGTSCLFSAVQNISGGRMVFGFLPPHGRELAANEQYTVFGNIIEAVAGKDGGDRVTSRRHVRAFEAAISRGDIRILRTPVVVVEDTVTGTPKAVKSSSGVLGLADPCWVGSGSVSDTAGGRDFTG